MHVWVSVDLEGVTGLVSEHEMYADREDFATARRLATSDANAAIAGAFDAGAREVLVCDSHGPARTLLVEELDPRATLIRGGTKPGRMVEGLERGPDAAFLVGYHGRAGAGPGVLNHTWSGRELLGVRSGGSAESTASIPPGGRPTPSSPSKSTGETAESTASIPPGGRPTPSSPSRPIGEIALVAAVAGHHGVPVVLVTGDDVACAEAEAEIPGVRTAEVKRAVDRFAAEVRHPDVTRPLIREAAARALRDRERWQPLAPPAPFAIEVAWSSTTIAAHCALIPGVRRTGERENAYEGADVLDAYRTFVAMSILAGAVAEHPPYS